MTTDSLAAILAIALVACAPQVLNVPEQAPADIRIGCELATHRCARCHTLDRVTQARVASPEHWQRYVHRMRLTPGSAIRPDEEEPLTRCLVFRSFGAKGLAEVTP